MLIAAGDINHVLLGADGVPRHRVVIQFLLEAEFLVAVITKRPDETLPSNQLVISPPLPIQHTTINPLLIVVATRRVFEI